MQVFIVPNHGSWVCVKALLHSLEQMLALPSCNPPLWRDVKQQF